MAKGNAITVIDLGWYRIGRKIQIARENKNIRRTDIAAKLGVQTMEIEALEKGYRMLSYGQFQEILTALEVSENYLITCAREVTAKEGAYAG